MLQPGLVLRDNHAGADVHWSTFPVLHHQDLQEESHEPPPPTKRIAKLLRKTDLCKHYQRGHCRFADKCAYAHQAEELMPKPNLTKTRMCIHFLAGCCRSARCSYAHGSEEFSRNTRAAARRNQAFNAPSPGMLRPYEVGDVSIHSQQTPMPVGLSSPELLHQRPEGRQRVKRGNRFLAWQPRSQMAMDGGLANRRQQAANGLEGFIPYVSENMMVAHDSVMRYANSDMRYTSSDIYLRPGLQYRGIDRKAGLSDGQTVSTTSSDGNGYPNDIGAAQFFGDCDGVGNVNGWGFSEAPIAATQTNHTNGADLDALVSRKHRITSRWQSLVSESMGRHSSWKVWLFEWLCSCEHAPQLSPAMELKIANLFLRDSTWAAKFPRLSRQCMERLARHLRSAWEDPDEGDVYSL